LQRLLSSNNSRHTIGLSLGGILISLGIVFGDIGTSPLYVIRAIIAGRDVIEPDFIFGALSCIFWTLTFQTTIKYISITLNADNKGEGGIFALFALIRRRYKWVYLLAVIGGSTLLADGIITPAITITSAVEGLNINYPDLPVIPIALIIIFLLFILQQFGTKFLGNSFGPMMIIWFLMLGTLGIVQVLQYPGILNALNPYYVFRFFSYPGSFILLGAVFLCTTGAEALYSDIGHCGAKNIRISWIFVKVTLILNYMGQGAWILKNQDLVNSSINPFYAIVPSFFIIPSVIIATIAAIIASQALITGTFTLISEAISLNFWPRVKKNYPTLIKGQVYVPSINWFLCIACSFVILFFKESANMEAAYGLSITITMLMTTLMLAFYLRTRHTNPILIGLMLLLFLTIEGSFLIANLNKFYNGGWFTVFIAAIYSIVMYTWFNARKMRNMFLIFVRLNNYIQVLKDLCHDESVPKFASNLVYISRANNKSDIESSIMYSILNKHPKRADRYWFLHIDIGDEPYTLEYEITQFVPDTIIKVDFYLGFKVEPKINLYFRQVVHEMLENKEIELTSKYESLKKHNIAGEFQFVIIDRIPNYDFDFSVHDNFIVKLYQILRLLGTSEIKTFGLDNSNILIEKVPLVPEDLSHSNLEMHRRNAPTSHVN